MSELGVIAAGDPQTAEAGAEVLRAGGNAVDGVVAAAFTAFIAEMPLASPAGAGVALWGQEDRYEVVDFFTRMPGIGAPARSRQTMDFFPVCVDFGPTTQEFHVGRGAAAVPTALDGLLCLHGRGGRLPLSDVLAPAVRCARDGVRISAAVSWIIQLLEPIMLHSPGVAELACVDGGLVAPNQWVRNPALADVLEQLGTDRRERVLADVRHAYLDEFGVHAGGLLTEHDLSGSLVTVGAPLSVSLKDTRVYTNPPPSSGGVLIALGLRLARLSGMENSSFMSEEHMGTLCRVLGGMSYARTEGLPAVLADPTRTEAFLDEAAQWLRSGSRSTAENPLGSTTHISVLDADGMAASLTMSNGEGCGHVLPGLGIHMNNFLGEADINPTGFHSLEAGVRMTTMMAPTIATTAGVPRLVLGSGGSNRIRSVVLQVLLNRIGFGLPIQDSIDAARCHIEGDRLWFEQHGLTPEVVARLKTMREHVAVFEEPHMYFGGVHTVGMEASGFVGVGDARRDGVALVVRK